MTDNTDTVPWWKKLLSIIPKKYRDMGIGFMIGVIAMGLVIQNGFEFRTQGEDVEFKVNPLALVCP